jgi:hypothetical protein
MPQTPDDPTDDLDDIDAPGDTVNPTQRIQYRDAATRYFLDCEFLEGPPLELISLGLVCADGREYYAVSADVDLRRANAWVKAHVLPHLPVRGPRWRTRAQIRDDLLGFFSEARHPELWSYYGSYDFVLFAQLFGRMTDIPDHVPRYGMDLKQLSVEVGSPRHPPHPDLAHDALEDARYHRDLFAFLRAVRTPEATP